MCAVPYKSGVHCFGQGAIDYESLVLYLPRDTYGTLGGGDTPSCPVQSAQTRTDFESFTCYVSLFYSQNDPVQEVRSSSGPAMAMTAGREVARTRSRRAAGEALPYSRCSGLKHGQIVLVDRRNDFVFMSIFL